MRAFGLFEAKLPFMDPRRLPTRLAELLDAALSVDPSARPTAVQIVEAVASAIGEVPVWQSSRPPPMSATGDASVA